MYRRKVNPNVPNLICFLSHIYFLAYFNTQMKYVCQPSHLYVYTNDLPIIRLFS